VFRVGLKDENLKENGRTRPHVIVVQLTLRRSLDKRKQRPRIHAIPTKLMILGGIAAD
jgi:hypothetical protein